MPPLVLVFDTSSHVCLSHCVSVICVTGCGDRRLRGAGSAAVTNAAFLTQRKLTKGRLHTSSHHQSNYKAAVKQTAEHVAHQTVSCCGIVNDSWHVVIVLQVTTD